MRGDGPVSDLLLEQYRLGELLDADRERLGHRLQQDRELANRLKAIEQSDLEIAAAGVLTVVRRSVAERIGPIAPASRRSEIWWLAPALAGIALVVMVALPSLRPNSSNEDRAKGASATLMIYRDTEAGSEMLVDNAAVHPGDVVRVGYRVSERGYGAIVSVDGRGHITWHLPPDAAGAVLTEPGKPVLLSTAFELDDAPRIERFYLVTAASPFAPSVVIDAVRGAPDAPALPAGVSATSFSLRKEPRP